jgi:hypothetical protein
MDLLIYFFEEIELNLHESIFCEVSKKLFETNLEKISLAVVFPVMKREYETQVR